MKSKNKLVGVTARIKVRDALAIESLAKKAGLTESAYLRKMIENDVAILTEAVDEGRLIELQDAVNAPRPAKKKMTKTPWWLKTFGIGR